jgi:hypothetical protein
MMIHELLTRIDTVSFECRNKYSDWPAAYVHYNVCIGNWSVGQIFKHLILVNESYYPIIQSVWRGTYKLPLIGSSNFIVDQIGRIILKAVSPTNTRKKRTCSIWDPEKTSTTDDIINSFLIHQEELKKFIRSCADLVELNVVISSPVNRYIVHRIGKAFEIIVTHEERHMNQAKAVKVDI